MPELPEVETIRRGLEKYLVGHIIERVEVRTHKSLQSGEEKLIGGKITGTRRFGKVLVIDLDNGYSALIHLKLTGQTIYRGPNLKNPPEPSRKIFGGLPSKHTHVIFYLDRGGAFYFNDYRKFGWIKVVKTAEVEKTPFIENMGPEPFVGTQGKPSNVLTRAKFKEIVSKVKMPIKFLLLDQTKIGGVGNIYANEALWKAGINPRRTSSSLSSREQKDLFNSVIYVLKKSLEAGGSSENAYVTSEGTEGTYQNFFLVYSQQGKLCPRCKSAKITKNQFRGRGTYFCPNCQK
jgi:formamidopyrimidine-DNA glycosylase